MYVDDFMFAGTKLFHENVTEKVSTKFKVGLRKTDVFKYVGLNIRRENDNIILLQDEYVNELQPFEIDLSKEEKELTSDDIRLLREVGGQLLWISSQTRPDLSFDSLEMSVSRNQASINTLKRCLKVIKKAKEKSSSLVFRPTGEDIKLYVFADAGFCNLPDKMSNTAGFVIILVGEKEVAFSIGNQRSSEKFQVPWSSCLKRSIE